MGLIYLLNALSFIAIAVIAFYTYFSWHKKKSICKIGRAISINGIFFLIFAILNLLWFFKVFEPFTNDIVLLQAIFTILSSVLILFIVYELTSNNNLLYLLFLFLLVSFLLRYEFNTVLLFMTAIAYLLLLIVFLNLLFFSNFYLKKAGAVGVAYAILSLLLIFFAISRGDIADLCWFLPNILLFFVFFFIYLDVKKCGVIKKKAKKKKKPFLPLIFIKYFIFVISMTLFMFLSTVGIHELGHVLTAQYYGCEEGKAIIYDINKMPHAEMGCDENYNETVISFGGLAATLIMAALFFFIGGDFLRIIAYYILGLSLFIAYDDLLSMGLTYNLVVPVMLISVIIIGLAIVKVSSYYLNQHETFCKNEGKHEKKNN